MKWYNVLNRKTRSSILRNNKNLKFNSLKSEFIIGFNITFFVRRKMS